MSPEVESGSMRVVAVCRDARHRLRKEACLSIRLVAGLGIEGDAHAGATVQHLSRMRRDPSAPNLRQVHLLHAEFLDGLAARGFELVPGRIGENVTTRGVDLLALPTGTRLRLGPSAIVAITGLRNPCEQLDRIQSGLMAAALERAPDGALVRKAGVMAIVVVGGDVAPGDPIEVELPSPPHRALAPV